MEFVVRAALIGIGATAVFDLWVRLLVLLRLPAANWALVGRWFAHAGRGRFAHADIAAAPPVRGEAAIGWIMHYLVGILFAAALLAIWGLDWARAPTLGPALAVGLVTVLAGWLILAPGMGAGIASRKRPNPNRIRLVQVAGHVVFGLGLYLAAVLVEALA